MSELSERPMSKEELAEYWGLPVRFTLRREVNMFGKGTVAFIMLNPSTADDEQDDPTIRRCIDFVQQWGYGSLEVANLSPVRATSPAVLRSRGAEGAELWAANVCAVLNALLRADLVVAAWGVHGVYEERDKRMLAAIQESCSKKRPIYCLGTTKYGHPRHPLYLPAATGLERYR